MADNPNPLRERRKALKLSMAKVGGLIGVPHQTIEKLEKGERKLTKEWAVRLAPILGCSPEELLFSGGEKMVQVMGYVGAGAQMVAYSEGDPLNEWVKAPAFATDKTVALMIRGDSLGPQFDGWYLFYDEVRSPVTPDLLGRLCVVEIDDGRVMVKQIKRGQLEGRYNLHSNNTGPPIYDAAVNWAALVKGMNPDF